MDWSPHVPPPEGRGLGGLFLVLVSPSAPAPLCNCCRKVLAPRTNPTSCYFDVVTQNPGKSGSGCRI